MDPTIFEELRQLEGARPKPALRRRVAEAFERDAVAAWTAHCGEHDWLPASTAGSPWPAPNLATIWAPLAPAANSLLSQLSKRTLGFMVRQREGRWQLGYVLEMGTGAGQHYHLAVWVGGPANAAPRPPSERVDGEKAWDLPSELHEFYAVHDGFGPYGADGFGVCAVVAAHELAILPAVIGHSHDDRRPILQESGFLAFLVDSVGGRRGYYRQGDRVYKKAFEWDRYTRSVGQLQSALSVINRELSSALRG